MPDGKPIPPRYWTCKNKVNADQDKETHFGLSQVNLGSEYSDDEKEWLAAVMKFQAKHRRYPTMQEAFAIAWSLGYRLTGDEPPAEESSAIETPVNMWRRLPRRRGKKKSKGPGGAA